MKGGIKVELQFRIKESPEWKKLETISYREYENGDITIKRRTSVVNTNYKHLEYLLSTRKILTTEDDGIKVSRGFRSLILTFLLEHPKFKDRVFLDTSSNRYVLRIIK